MLTQDGGALLQIFLFFAKAGAFVFGSGLAIPFLYGGTVTEHHWLTEKQFFDAVAVAMITPNRNLSAVLSLHHSAAPYFKKYGKLPAIVAFLDGVTAAAIGAIAGAVIVIAERSITDIPTATAALAVVTAVLLWRFKKLPEPVIVLGAAAFGLLLYPLFHA